jgi:hypothetical protein
LLRLWTPNYDFLIEIHCFSGFLNDVGGGSSKKKTFKKPAAASSGGLGNLSKMATKDTKKSSSGSQIKPKKTVKKSGLISSLFDTFDNPGAILQQPKSEELGLRSCAHFCIFPPIMCKVEKPLFRFRNEDHKVF